MAKKRKPQDAAVLEELGKKVFQDFTAAANSISQMYSSAETQRRITFHAGEQHGLEKIYQWILSRQEAGLSVNEADIISYLQNELGYAAGEASMPPTSSSNQTGNADTLSPTLGTPVQDSHLLRGTKQMKRCGPRSAPSNSISESTSIHTAQGGFYGGSSLQAPKTGSTHQNQEDNLSASSDSPMNLY